MLRVLKYKVQISKPKTLVVSILKKKKNQRSQQKQNVSCLFVNFTPKKKKMTENIGHVMGEVVSSRSINI